MSDTHETIADIIAEMKGEAAQMFPALPIAVLKLATRLDAAHKRERGKRDAECDAASSPLTLDEAIAHADEVAGNCGTACKREHKQLAEWLGELKARRSAERGDAAKLREALVKCREIALQWQADEAAGVAGTTDKPHARSAAEAVIDMEFEINAALAATEKEGGAK